jgi:Flp pilus assembly pilin Flp
MLLNSYVRLRTMVVCRKGQGLVEYLILLTVIAVGVIGVALAFRTQLRNMFNYIKDSLRKAQTTR